MPKPTTSATAALKRNFAAENRELERRIKVMRNLLRCWLREIDGENSRAESQRLFGETENVVNGRWLPTVTPRGKASDE